MTDINSPLLQSVWWNAQRQRVEVKADIWSDDALWRSSSSGTASEQPNVLYESVPWLFRAVEMRAGAVASVPFRIMRGEEEEDKSEAWTNKVGFWLNPWRDLWLIEAALCFGPAYLYRERNTVVTKALRYHIPATVTPKIDKDKGLTGFERNIGGIPQQVPVEDYVYFWKPDYTVELGPPNATPAKAALAAAGVLYNLSAFEAAFWKRGAIKATLLTIDGPSTPEAREDLKSWWQRAVTGINNAFSSRVISANVKPIVIGEGLDSLQNSALTAEQRSNIIVALGIPQTMFDSTTVKGIGGGGIAKQDEMNFFKQTVIPECNFIAGVLNSQLFAKAGLRMEFMPETLEVFQEDENSRAVAFKAYTDAGLPASLVAEMLGLDLPPGWEYADLDLAKPVLVAPQTNGAVPPGTNGAKPPGGDVNAEVDAIVAGLTKALEPALVTVSGNGNGAQIAPTAALDDTPNEIEYEDDAEDVWEKALDDLRKWRAKSKKRGSLAPFESECIPAHIVAAVKECGFDWLSNWQELKAKQPDRAAEEQLRKAIAKLLQEQRDRIAEDIAAGRPIDWAQVERELSQRMTPALVKIATDQAIAQAVEAGLGFDIAQINLAAWKWATEYSYELIKGITATTQEIVANATAQFIATPGMTVGDLTAMLDSAFGETRAKMIAVTETTRAYSRATMITQAMLRNMGIETLRVWNTAGDEKVCDRCGALDGKTEDEWPGINGVDDAPAHVNCRCNITNRFKR